jgi:hypothetical protein
MGERDNYWFCTRNLPCPHKLIKASKRFRGIYYVVCVNPYGCVYKSLYCVKIDLTRFIQESTSQIRWIEKSQIDIGEPREGKKMP